jgi:hypothetical protein
MSCEIKISDLSRECAAGHVKWTAHTLERMQERDIKPDDVMYCINNGKIIEQYPQSYPYLACLILGTRMDNTYIHVVVGYGEGLIWIITVYEPDKNKWINSFTARKG